MHLKKNVDYYSISRVEIFNRILFFTEIKPNKSEYLLNLLVLFRASFDAYNIITI